MKKILVPTDFSQNAYEAIKFVFTLFKDTALEIHLLNIMGVEMIDYSEVQMVNQESVLKIKHESNKRMDELAEKINTDFDFKNVIIKTHVESGSIVREINLFVEQHQIDLVVMGTQGENHNLAEKIIGTISTAVLNNPNCPTILVPSDHEVKEVDNIVFATNLEKGDAFELWKVVKLLKPCSPEVRCLYVKKDDSKMNESDLALFAKFIMDSSPSIQTVFNIEHGKNVAKSINVYIQDYDAKLLVMHKSKKSFYSRIYGLSQTKSMVHKLKVPMLVMN